MNFTPKVYFNFADVEDDIYKNVPPTVYKYRQWDIANHKTIITQQEIWLSHPKDLNDPYDCRPPHNIILDGLEKYGYQKLWEMGRKAMPHVTEVVLKNEIDERWVRMQENPIDYFQKNYKVFVEDASNYNQFGVFSTSTNGLNESLWANYADNHRGFCVGFNTVELAKLLECGFGVVEYSNIPIDFDPIYHEQYDVEARSLYLKSAKWVYEEEFRFITLTIGIIRNERLTKFPPEIITEILLGHDIHPAAEKDIRQNVKHIFGEKFPVYKVGTKTGSFGMERNK